MSLISLEDYEDLLNIPICESPKAKERPSFVPSLRLSTPSSPSANNEPLKPSKQLTHLQQVIIRKKARDFIESKQIQNFESFECSHKVNYSVDEILAQARIECGSKKVTKYFDVRVWMQNRDRNKAHLKKKLGVISESNAFLEQPDDDNPFNLKNLQ